MSCDKKKLQLMKKLQLKSGLRSSVGLIVEGYESANDCGPFYVFGLFLKLL